MAAAVAALSAPGAATAAPPLQPLRGGNQAAMSDGARFVAWGSRSDDGVHAMHVLDTASGREFDTPAPRIYCRPVGLGAGRLLWQCGREEPPPSRDAVRMGDVFVRDLRSGSLIQGAGTRDVHTRFPEAGELRPLAIGERWIEAAAIPGVVTRPTQRFFLDWRSGALRFPTARRDSFDDLDAPGLAVRLCRPLVRRDHGSYRYQFDAPLGLEAGPVAPLRLTRCGGRPRTLTTLPLLGFTAPRLSAGLVTWGELRMPGRAVAIAYDARTGRTMRWPIPDQTSSPPLVEHTASTVVVTVLRNGGAPPRFYRATVR
jgi:hypothetical protein